MKKSTIDSKLIAPCGINCGVCLAHLRKNNPCPGCRIPDSSKPITRVKCKIKTCRFFEKTKGKTKFCFQCKDFPCNNLEHLDKRYRTKYNMSMIENLNNLKTSGIKEFIKNQDLKYTCNKCKGTICVHTGSCINCKTKK